MQTLLRKELAGRERRRSSVLALNCSYLRSDAPERFKGLSGAENPGIKDRINPQAPDKNVGPRLGSFTV